MYKRQPRRCPWATPGDRPQGRFSPSKSSQDGSSIPFDLYLRHIQPESHFVMICIPTEGRAGKGSRRLRRELAGAGPLTDEASWLTRKPPVRRGGRSPMGYDRINRYFRLVPSVAPTRAVIPSRPRDQRWFSIQIASG